MSFKASDLPEREKDICTKSYNDYFEDDEDIEDFMISYSTQESTKQTTDFDGDDDDHIEDYMQSYNTPVKVDYRDVGYDVNDDTEDLWEGEDSFEEVLNEMISISPKISNDASKLNLLDGIEVNDIDTESYFSDDEVLDYMSCYNTQIFTNQNNVKVSLDIQSLTDNPLDVELNLQCNSDSNGRKTEPSFKNTFFPNGQKPEPNFKKPCFINGQKPEGSFKKPLNVKKPEGSFKKPYTSKWSENFRKQHIEGKHRPNKPVNTVADFQSGGGFKILRKSGSSKNSVVPGRHEGQIKVVTKEAIPYRETGFKRRGQTGSKLFMVTAKKLNGVDSVVPEHLDGAATWENGKIRVGQEIYSQCTQQTQRYMC